MKKLTLILTLIPALTLSTRAAYLVVDGTAHPAENGAAYASSGDHPALTVTGTGGFYSGTNITLTGTAGVWLQGRQTVFVTYGGQLDLYDSTVTNAHYQWPQALYVIDGVVNTYNVNMVVSSTTDETNSSAAIRISTSGTVISNGGTVKNLAPTLYGVVLASNVGSVFIGNDVRFESAHEGIVVTNGAYVELNRVELVAADGKGVRLANWSDVDNANVVVINSSTIISGSHAISAEAGAITLNNSLATTTGAAAVLEVTSGTFATHESSIIVNGGTLASNGGPLLLVSNSYSSSVTLNQVDTAGAGGIVTNGTSFLGDSTITVNGGSGINGSLNHDTSGSLALTLRDTGLTGDLTVGGSSSTAVNLDHGTVSGDLIASDNATIGLTAGNGSVIVGNITGNDDTAITLAISDSDTTLSGTITGNNNSTLAVTVSDNSTLTGDLIGSDSSTLDVTVSDGGTLTGNINTSEDNHTIVTISDGGIINGDLISIGNSTLGVTVSDSGTHTGNLTASDNSSLNLNLNENGTVIGDITGSGSSTLNVTVSDNSTLTGNLTVNDDNKTTVTISDGGVIIGDLIGNDNSALAMTVGDGGTLIGGINGERVTVTVDTGGNVILNKDSNFGSLDNNGTLNVGDYQVSVSDLANNGTIDIAVNTDSGAHGTLHVTGTSSGAGTIHVTSTGDGQANPNDVLGNLVTGNGTANYTWDEVDWGLEELIVTPNPDGTISIKEDGTSPAGAVLNSAIAVQQSLWFAQQNSLLKRMGDLRYGARASRPLADKDVRVPYNSLIENLWLRSYGQQLNIGSQVAGKAYEQLIYGVDLGTDHKFTISADSDLYLGVYAGYGRSDLDYRTPGADGEINSYYGGLYATWLHSSGFYIDATFKAASVNNDLKAPYGSTQLKASYSDVNIGGSLEIGKKFTFSDAWFIEPQFQVNYLHILTENYTAGPMTISAQDLDALQLRLGSLFGRTINLTNSGALQPYIKVSGVETISTGGTLRNGYQHTRANTDGARAELGAGLIWQLDADNQLHLDYEASFGDKYDKPWGLTAGYRHQF